MNFEDTLDSVKLILMTSEVPLIVGESGIGKTALAKRLAREEDLELVTIDGNLLKEGEIGGLPIVDTYEENDSNGNKVNKKAVVYATHVKLREIDKYIKSHKKVLLFIDEINRCEHAVQQELMNLILNREINGYILPQEVKIIAAMNPSSKYGENFDYQVVDMDAAQENRFVWLKMEADSKSFIMWATRNNINSKIIDFISTFPDYLYKKNEEDVDATPRSYERISKVLDIYNQNKSIKRSVLLNVLKGNVGNIIAEELMNFIESDLLPLITFQEVFSKNHISSDIIERIKSEVHTRLYLSAMNILEELDNRFLKFNTNEQNDHIDMLVEFLSYYPKDLMIGIMKDIKLNYKDIYKVALENSKFIDIYFKSYEESR